MKRRRFLQIVAGAALVGRPLMAQAWQGRAFGADIGIDLRGATASPELLHRLRAEIVVLEKTFSLYRDSELSALNRIGERHQYSNRMRDVLAVVRDVHEATGGMFDPTVQGRWQALAEGRDASRVGIGAFPTITPGYVRLNQGQPLTLNGVVQGYAADRIRTILRQAGMTDVLVNMGELAALGGPFDLGVADPQAGMVAELSLRDGEAMATSSPRAIWLPGGTHILGPQGQRPHWSTVTVRARSGALADATSTAFVLMDRPAIAQAARKLDLGDVHLVDFEGNFGPL